MNKKPHRIKHQIEIQRVYRSEGQPGRKQISQWIQAALNDIPYRSECLVRIVDELESAELNRSYRHKHGPTNILSFPFEWPEEIDADEGDAKYLGDLVICAPIVEQEALEQNKALQDHWAHILIHGVLHLLGYDHIHEVDAERMESKEIEILEKLHINNPYSEALNS